MAYLLRFVHVPQSVPDFYPAIDPADPGAYPVRVVQMRMFIRAMLHAGCVEDRPVAPDESERPRISSSALWNGDGYVVTPEQCNEIARGMREAFMRGVPDAIAQHLRFEWDEYQQQMQRAVEAQGEVAIAGFESFPYDAASLRNDLVHFGAYNAVAAQNGGYAVNPPTR